MRWSLFAISPMTAGTVLSSSSPIGSGGRTAFAARHGLDPEYVNHFAHGRPAGDSVRLLAPNADHEAETATIRHTELRDTDGVRALPGAAELLSAPPRPLAIVTSCSTALAHARLRAAELPIPSVLVSSDGLERGKPDPECFLIGARRLEVEPEACLVLEDAPARNHEQLRTFDERPQVIRCEAAEKREAAQVVIRWRRLRQLGGRRWL